MCRGSYTGRTKLQFLKINIIHHMNGCFSLCLTSFIFDIFSKTEQYFLLLDKLLPDSVMASSRSEENILSDRYLPSHYAGLAWEIATSPIIVYGRSAAQPRVGTHNNLKIIKDIDLIFKHNVRNILIYKCTKMN